MPPVAAAEELSKIRRELDGMILLRSVRHLTASEQARYAVLAHAELRLLADLHRAAKIEGEKSA
jgi:hypothetical protein